MEVFTISGPADEPGTIDYQLAHRRVAASPTSTTSGSASPVVRLQNALRALGVTMGNSMLQSVAIDGVVGPATVRAVNFALANAVGASPMFPHANLTAIQVQQSAYVLADRITARVKASGGTVPDPSGIVATMKKHAARISRALAPVVSEPSPSEPSDHRWVFWVVGGASVLVLLSVATVALKKKRREAHA
jgi:hypothetical protein